LGQKAITIYTPEGTAAHIAAEDDAFVHRCALGGDSGLLGALACVKADDNTVRLSGGGVSNHGYILWIPEGETVELAVDSGTAGYNRIDTVAAVFSRGGGDVPDTHTFAVVKGAAVTGTPSAPSLSSSALLSAGQVNQTALFYVRLTGTQITSITRAGRTLPAASSLPAMSFGTAAPSGGSDGDIYFRIES
jgi:hypothetical protein